MTWAGWCLEAEVRYRVKQAVAAAGWDDDDIQPRIDRAERTLTVTLWGLYGTAEIATWSTSCPPLIADICADQAAVYVLADWHGEAQMREGKPGERLQARVDLALKALLSRQSYLVRVDGSQVPFVAGGESLIESTTRDREPTFTLGSQVLDPSKPGSLDGY